MKTEFKNVGLFKRNSKQFYRGQIQHNNDIYQSKALPTPEQAARWVDLKCLELGIPQKNNTFKKK